MNVTTPKRNEEDNMMTNEKKMALTIQYLKAGGEIDINGKTFVWLDNHVIEETETALHVIDGLAIKGRSYNGLKDEVGTVCYLGQSNIPLHQFIQLIDAITDRQVEEMLINLTLTEFNQAKAAKR